ncbi:hypothetical protein BJ508DRAFT_329551 [Ascobolus immersus RN42]|uniref:Uncharacterized protein n=1 Tax=Ascobolus immersus RN42 TaxID=1160509 RepID=A0A3N4HWE6_ASCIM|nr:hypothetical protein BJ508DRAFT_329551 [Ascobolus immersus RN42]
MSQSSTPSPPCSPAPNRTPSTPPTSHFSTPHERPPSPPRRPGAVTFTSPKRHAYSAPHLWTAVTDTTLAPERSRYFCSCCLCFFTNGTEVTSAAKPRRTGVYGCRYRWWGTAGEGNTVVDLGRGGRRDGRVLRHSHVPRNNGGGGVDGMAGDRKGVLREDLERELAGFGSFETLASTVDSATVSGVLEWVWGGVVWVELWAEEESTVRGRWAGTVLDRDGGRGGM